MEGSQKDNAHEISTQNSIKIIGYLALNLEQSRLLIYKREEEREVERKMKAM